MGVEASAQMYSGTPITSISSIDWIGPPSSRSRTSLGSQVWMAAAARMPITIQPKMSSNNLTKAYRIAPRSRDDGGAAISLGGESAAGLFLQQLAPCVSGCGSTRAGKRRSIAFSMSPAVSAVTHEAIGRNTAMSGPNSEYVSSTDVALVSGVEMRNASVAPLPAPFFRKVTAAGSTLHEQSGSGTPINVPSSTERRRDPLSRRLTRLAGTILSSSPAMAKPNMIKAADSQRMDQVFVSIQGSTLIE